MHPCLFEGQPTIFYEAGLRQRDPEGFRWHVEFAAANGLRLREERRSTPHAVVKERRGKGLTMLVLGASLFGMAGGAAAGSPGVVSGALSTPRAPMTAAPSDEFVVRDLLDWLSAQNVAVDPLWRGPLVKRVSQDEILALAFGGQLPASVSRDSLKVYGLYNFKNETIYLMDDIDLASEHGRSVLVHELVHYLQYQDGTNNRVRCKNELETLAYELEARYLQQHDHAPGFSAGQVRRLSLCG